MGILTKGKMDTTNYKHLSKRSIAFWGDSLTEGFPGVSYFEILKQRLPEDNLINYGKGGDTVLSLYRRLKRTQLSQPVDIAFLWVGVNDIFVKLSGSYLVYKTILNQPWTRNYEEFERYYRLTLEILCQHANKVITVPPLFLGEGPNNKWNRELGMLSRIIKQVSNLHPKVNYLDLRKIIYPQLSDKKTSAYLPASLTRIGLDTLLLKQKAQIDKMAFERGLVFTLDGVHLNSRGAEIVADIFLENIKALRG